MDVGHAVWRPVGHATLLALAAWLGSALVAIAALVARKGRVPIAWMGLLISTAGLLLLLTV